MAGKRYILIAALLSSPALADEDPSTLMGRGNDLFRAGKLAEREGARIEVLAVHDLRTRSGKAVYLQRATPPTPLTIRAFSGSRDAERAAQSARRRAARGRNRSIRRPPLPLAPPHHC